MNKPGLTPSSWLLLALLLAAPGQALALDAVAQLKECARTADSRSRMACFEALGKAVLQAEVEGTLAAPPAAATTLPDTFGGEVFAKAAEPEDQDFRGQVVSCQKAVNNKWFYIFDNGQVWKQADAERRYYKECNFQVTISTDVFGYTMQIDGQAGRIRVRRQK